MTMMIVFARGRSSWIKTTTTTTVCRRSMVFRKTFRSNGGMASLLLSSDRKDTTLPDAIPIRRCKSFFSSYSSFAEPDPTLFAKSAAPTSSNTANAVDDAIDAQLRKDIRVMGSELGKVIQSHQGKDIFDKVETMRSYAKQWRNRDDSSSTEAFTHLVDYVSSFSNADLCAVARSFTHFLAIANAAEGHHRARRLAQTEPSGAFYNKSDSCGGAIPNLLAQGHPAEKIFQTLSTQTTELVLTAHPTEVNRRTILDKHRRIQEILTRADALRKTEFSSSSSSSLSSSFEVQQLDDALYREISSIWLSDELSRVKPTPEEEAEKGTLVVETVLWNALPSFVRKLDYTCRQFLRKPLPLTAAPVKFASWMGGDRDGNPNVKPDTTRTVCLLNRRKAATLLHRDLEAIQKELSLTECSDELRKVVGNYDDAREPYRAFLKPMLQKLANTIEWADQELERIRHNKEKSPLADTAVEDIYISRDEFRDQLLLIHRSLCETGNEVVADGKITDILRNVAAFGLTLTPLDVRQESDRHEEAVDAITRFLGLGSFSQWDEQTKISWLAGEIMSKRPLLRPGIWHEHLDKFSPTVIDTLGIFRMIADQHEGSLGAYVISQATSASDVLSVLLLQLDAGVKKPLRVVPLFETLDDLNGAATTMKQLFSLPAYMGMVNGKQEVMIGYSDSAKDAGRLAASWAQYETQEELAKLAKFFNVDVTFFHGKGGTVGRGGNPQTFLAIMAHAPETINGKFRVTEQGEMINRNLGFGPRAERTMDIYTAAVLSEMLTKREAPSATWREMMAELSKTSCDAYRKIVRGDERFVPYFRSATPELELASLNIGSRPAKRKASGGVESLRAIPWIFAWTQTRLNLPTWLGVGEAIQSILKSDKAQVLRDMYKNWGSFQTTIDMVEMILAKSDSSIAKHYEDVLVKEESAKELGLEIRSLHLDTESAILELTGHKKFAENSRVLQRSLQVRNPYVDCLNVLQAETLKRKRQLLEGEEDEVLNYALKTTITGIANGMGNTG